MKRDIKEKITFYENLLMNEKKKRKVKKYEKILINLYNNIEAKHNSQYFIRKLEGITEGD